MAIYAKHRTLVIMNIKQNPIVSMLIEELSSQYQCHTIILYGSHARGQATPSSDYDLAGICETGKMTRLARFDTGHQVYIDLFIYPEHDLINIKEEHLCMHDGLVLKEKNGFGTDLLNKIKKILEKPTTLPSYELEVRKVWYQNMLARTRVRDIDGQYRHIWVLHTLIEDYFAFRNLRYLGPKKSFEYLKQHDLNLLTLYQVALSNTEDLDAFERLIHAVVPME
jgi:uncharacterized protein